MGLALLITCFWDGQVIGLSFQNRLTIGELLVCIGAAAIGLRLLMIRLKRKPLF
jgi:uncharacterized membrane protein YczE